MVMIDDTGTAARWWFYELKSEPRRVQGHEGNLPFVWPPGRHYASVWVRASESRTPAGQNVGSEAQPRHGDLVVLYHAGSDLEPRFYGWAVINEYDARTELIDFQPLPPSGHCPTDGIVRAFSCEGLGEAGINGKLKGHCIEGVLWPVGDLDVIACCARASGVTQPAAPPFAMATA